MSRPLLISIGLLFLGFCLGIGAGLHFGNSSAVSDTSASNGNNASSANLSDNAEGQQRIEANTVLSNRIRELEKELSDQTGKNGSITTDKMDFFKKYHQQLRVQGVDLSGKITPEMAEILGLSKDEQQAAEQHLSAAAQAMQKMEDDDTALVKQTPNSFTMGISPDPQGKVVKGQLKDQLSTDIGPDRADFLMNSDGYETDGSFAGFGEENKQIEISWSQQSGKTSYAVTTRVSSPTGGSYTRTSNSTFVPPEYQKYVQQVTGQ